MVYPSSGTAPLFVTFSTNVAGSAYYIDFGSGGTTAWVGNGLNASAASPCTPDSSGNCLYKTVYTYPANGSYTATLINKTSTANVPVGTATITVGFIPDTQPPTVPKNIATSSISKFQIGLKWSPATDNVGVTGYNVYRAGVNIGSASSTTYVDSGLNPGTTYIYNVSAFDAAGNESAKSASFSVTTLPSTYAVGTRIKTTLPLNVRSKAGTNSKILGTQPAGALGTITLGPQKNNDYTWWYVQFDSGVSGWIVQDISIMNTLSVRSSRSFFSLADALERLQLLVNVYLSQIDSFRSALTAAAALAK